MKWKIRSLGICLLLIISILPISGEIVTIKENNEISTHSLSNGWYKTYGGPGLDCFKGLDITHDDGFIVAGETEIDGDKQAWMVNINGNGVVLWEVIYGTTAGRDALWPVIATTDGGFLGGGWFFNETQQTNDALLIKTDAAGSIEWVNTYGGEYDDQFYSLLEIDNGYLAVGMTSSFSNGTYDGFISKIDFDGTLLWMKSLGKTGYGSEVDGICETNDEDGYLITGGHYSSTESPQGRLIKVDENGTILWDKSYGEDAKFDWWISVANTNDNNYIIAGGTKGGPYGNGIMGPDIWIIKVDDEGTILWEESIGLPFLKDYSLYGQQVSTGGYIFTGHMFGIGGWGDHTHAPWSKIILIKYSENGEREWIKFMPKTGHGRTVREIDDGFIICGFEGPGHGTGSEHGILIKTNHAGEINN